MSRVVVIDDEPELCENIRRLLRLPDVTVEPFTDPRAGLVHVLDRPPDALLLDIHMPGMSGEELFAKLHEAHPEVPVVFLTAYGSIEGAVLAMRSGAFDYLRKPFKREDLLLAVRRALERRDMEREVESLRGRLEELGEADAYQSHSALMQAEIAKARQAAATDATILILGESGTGKEVMARWIHSQSERRGAPFVPIDCTALPASLVESELFGHEKGAFTGALAPKRGLIEAAQGGTLFLDEIGDLPVDFQTKLFRFVEEREIRRVGAVEPIRVDCRILCATNQDLQAKIAEGAFREELFYRLAVVTLKLPPLRQRPEDVTALARFFIQRFARQYGKEIGASPAFYEALLQRPWKGNVRELKNTIERLSVLCTGTQIEASDLEREEGLARGSAEDLSRLGWREAREKYLGSFQRSYAQRLLNRNEGNVSAAAREAGVDRKTFYAMLGDERSSRPGE
ncbi:MAG: sigma-54 dependent transcriptional regulator [Acidobacteriota bacterium]